MKERDLENEFKQHAPKNPETSEKYDSVRSCCLELGKLLDLIVPRCQEKYQALNKLNEVMFWANAAIARNEEEVVSEEVHDS